MLYKSLKISAASSLKRKKSVVFSPERSEANYRPQEIPTVGHADTSFYSNGKNIRQMRCSLPDENKRDEHAGTGIILFTNINSEKSVIKIIDKNRWNMHAHTWIHWENDNSKNNARFD